MSCAPKHPPAMVPGLFWSWLTRKDMFAARAKFGKTLIYTYNMAKINFFIQLVQEL
jgi:hypothetical protein